MELVATHRAFPHSLLGKNIIHANGTLHDFLCNLDGRRNLVKADGSC